MNDIDSTQAHLVEENLDFESIMNNPILNPIAQADKSLLDLDEMIHKKYTDISRDKDWVDAVAKECPIYNDSEFVSRLYRAFDKSSDVIKLQDLELKTLRNVVREILSIVKVNYMVSEKPVNTPPAIKKEIEKKQEEFDYVHYLESLKESHDDNVKSLSTEILDLFLTNTQKMTNKRKFELICSQVHKAQEDNERKKITSLIINLKQQVGEVQ